MKLKLLTCLFLSSGLILNPLAKNHTNATKPKPKPKLCYMDDSSASEKIPESDENKEATSDIELDSSICSDTDEESSSSTAPIEVETLTVGRHLNNRGHKADGTESHHPLTTSTCKALSLNPNNAPTVCFALRLHQRTSSHPSSGRSAKYHKDERTTLCKAMGVPETISDDELRETFSRMMPMQKYNCLKKVLDLGLSDLEAYCNVWLRFNPDCMEKIDAELKRLLGIYEPNNPWFTPPRNKPRNPMIQRRKSTASTSFKRPRSEENSYSTSQLSAKRPAIEHPIEKSVD